jgi:hypothetical protein
LRIVEAVPEDAAGVVFFGEDVDFPVVGIAVVVTDNRLAE